MSDKTLKDKAIDIQGKKYVLVSDRVNYFNNTYPKGSIKTSLISKPESDVIVIKAIVTPDVDKPERVFTDYAQEVIGSSFINKTSAMENASTSAVGRALAYMGIGVLDSIASVDEINKANNRESNSSKTVTEKQLEWIMGVAEKRWSDKAYEMAEKILGVKPEDVKVFDAKRAVDKLNAWVDPNKDVVTDVELSKEDEEKLKKGTLLDDIPY